MRQLTKAQEKYLDKAIHRHNKNNHFLLTYEDLDPSEWAYLEKLNNSEILWQEVNRYITDSFFDDLRQEESSYPRNNNKGPFAPF